MLVCLEMSKMVGARDVPEQVHGAVKSRAAREGMSFFDFMMREPKRLTMTE
jgi:hypothetical protein